MKFLSKILLEVQEVGKSWKSSESGGLKMELKQWFKIIKMQQGPKVFILQK